MAYQKIFTMTGVPNSGAGAYRRQIFMPILFYGVNH
jgi:hypothetical protein